MPTTIFYHDNDKTIFFCCFFLSISSFWFLFLASPIFCFKTFLRWILLSTFTIITGSLSEPNYTPLFFGRTIQFPFLGPSLSRHLPFFWNVPYPVLFIKRLSLRNFFRFWGHSPVFLFSESSDVSPSHAPFATSHTVLSLQSLLFHPIQVYSRIPFNFYKNRFVSSAEIPRFQFLA